MFEAREDLDEMIDRLFRAAAKLHRGQVIGHELITHIIGCPPHTDRWKHCIKKLKRRMQRDLGITIWSEPNVGYKLLTKDETFQIPQIMRKRARRRVVSGIRSMESLPLAGLSLHQQRLRAAEIQSLKQEHAQLTEQINWKTKFLRPTESLPRARKEPTDD